MMKGSFSLTAELFKDIFVEAIDATVQDIGSFFEIVDEEPITFTLILKTKKLISEKNDLIKQIITKDIVDIIQANSIRRADHYGVKQYVERNLVVDVVGHNRHFEHTKSGSDFGLLFSLPEITNRFGHINISPSFNGILIQAKRNALAGKKFYEYGILSKKHNYTDVKDFMAIALYKYEANRLISVNFLKPITEEMSNENYKKYLNDILRKYDNTEDIPAQEFLSLFVKKKVGICDQKKIETYIKNGNLPVFELNIHFKDNGRELDPFLRIMSSTKQVQTIRIERG